MSTHPLWRPFEQATIDDIRKSRVDGGANLKTGIRVEVVPYDNSWPQRFDEISRAIRSVLGDSVVAINHVGSTSVPGLAAKPVIDIDVVVKDSSLEELYVPQLLGSGFLFILREPEWEQHRLFVLDSPACNVHVFSAGANEPQRHLMFRDWLRDHPEDQAKYASLKRQLAGRTWETMMEYNNAKGALIYDIYERIFAADPAHPHTPAPIAHEVEK